MNGNDSEKNACAIEDVSNVEAALNCKNVLDVNKANSSRNIINIVNDATSQVVTKVNAMFLFESIVKGKKEHEGVDFTNVIMLEDGSVIGLNSSGQIKIGEKIFNSRNDLYHFFSKPYENGFTTSGDGFACLGRTDACKSIDRFWEANRMRYHKYLEKEKKSVAIFRPPGSTSGAFNIFPIEQVHKELGVECGGAVVVTALMLAGFIRPDLTRREFELKHTSIWDDLYLNYKSKIYSTDKSDIKNVLDERKKLWMGNGFSQGFSRDIYRRAKKSKWYGEILPSIYNVYFRGRPGKESFEKSGLIKIFRQLQQSDWAKIMGVERRKVKIKWVNKTLFSEAKKVFDSKKTVFYAYVAEAGDLYTTGHWVGVYQIKVENIVRGITNYKVSYIDNIQSPRTQEKTYRCVHNSPEVNASYFAWYLKIDY